MTGKGVIPKLLTWYEKNHRDLPWRHTTNPYEIWVSEMILQQTRVEQGTPYYYRFLDKFPQINDLAEASETEVLKVWQGLGYYARARNMHKAAKEICDRFEGLFPTSFHDIKALPGIGPYTAAAIASFAFNESVPCVDGNVKRVVSRWQGWSDDIGSVRFFNAAFEYLKEVLPAGKTNTFNQAMMEVGSLVCTPQSPKCIQCPFSEECVALRENKQHELPVKKGKTKTKKIEIHYFLVQRPSGEIAIIQRPNNGVWGGLYEFPSKEEAFQGKNYRQERPTFMKEWPTKKIELLGEEKHLLSHRTIHAYLWKLQPWDGFLSDVDHGFWATEEQIKSFPKHKLMLKFVSLGDVASED